MKALFKHLICILFALLCVAMLFSCRTSDGESTESTAMQSTGESNATTDSSTDGECNTDGKENTHTHSYSEKVIASTCVKGGYTEFSCSCGDSYKGRYTMPSYAHDFQIQEKLCDYLYYEAMVCTVCNTEAFEYGNADGSWGGGNDKVKFYVSGETYLEGSVDFAEIKHKNVQIVIYGNGKMPDFAKDENPLWADRLYEAKSIIIAHGITSIGERAFVCPDGAEIETFEISNTVRSINRSAINLNLKSLIIGDGVERIEDFALGTGVQSVYLPKSVKFFASPGFGNHVFYYQGSKEELYKMEMNYYGSKCTTKKYFEGFLGTGNEWMLSSMAIYINADSINDESEYLNLEREFIDK